MTYITMHIYFPILSKFSHCLPSMVVKISLFTIACLLFLSPKNTEAQIGVCYGRLGNNLPCAQDVVNLYEQYQIGAMRLYDPDLDTLNALQGTNIKLMLGVRNQDIISIACDQSNADEWVETYVVPFASTIKYIAVGNEIQPSDAQAPYMVPSMQNILNSLNSNDLDTQIIVSTAINSNLTTNTYPPSNSVFQNLSYITPIIDFLVTNDWPLLVNLQPYLAYVNDPKNNPLDFVLFTYCGYKYTDYKTGKKYQNLFDALYDSVYVAIQKVVASLDQKNYRNGKRFKNPVNSESSYSSGGFHSHHKARRLIHEGVREDATKCGYPKGGGEPGTIENARIFYTNMIEHVKKGTPLTQGQELEVYLFAMFDENNKPGDISEQHYGLFTPDGKPKYGILNYCVE